MRARIIRFLKHALLTLLMLVAIIVIIGLYIGALVKYDENPLMRNLDKEGPYVFYKNASTISVNNIRGNKNDGFHLEQKEYAVDSSVTLSCFFTLDSTYFYFALNSDFKTPYTTYNDNNTILAISDIESGYRTFRDFLIHNKVIDENLSWIFGNGHLVLVGDFVDRGYSTTQVLWFIYKLEQDAKKHGGLVHYIIGNHEIKNMQGRYDAASNKYYGVAAILGKRPHELYSQKSFLGKWMSSKNSIEKINGHLFAHGGVHPELIHSDISLDKINQIVRNNYYKIYFPEPEKTIDHLLLSNRKGIAWYRGYFKEDLPQQQIDDILQKFSAKSIIVGHTPQSEVNRQYEGKILGIDVRHPRDYRKTWPNKKSEGLLIEGNKYFRVYYNGEKEEI